MSFIAWPATCKNLDPKEGVVADVANHCSTWSVMRVEGDLITSAHEGTHGVNADIRNVVEGDTQGLYILDSQAIRIKELPFRKSDVTSSIPESFRGFRYPTYVTGQGEWDAKPSYLWDEWIAYINGAKCAIELVRSKGNKPDGSDWVRAPLEFCAYGISIAMTADKKGCLTNEIKEACKYLLTTSFSVYLDGKDYFPFEGQKELYETWLSGQGGKDYRDFTSLKLGWSVPTEVIYS